MRTSRWCAAGAAALALLTGTRCTPAGSRADAPPPDSVLAAPTSTAVRAAAGPVGATSRCTVRSVHDGDTLRCTDGRRVRLLGIDAPEIDQPAGAASRDALRARLPRGRNVLLEADVRPRDEFGRTLAYVWDGELLVNEAMLDAGMVLVLNYPPNDAYAARFRTVEAAARAARRGLWATDAFSCSPRAHRQGRC